MERKFMIYQRRDGFQIAEEATGTRLANGMDMLARPNKSADWCFAAFNIDLTDGKDGYELVGEESIDCSVPPAQMIEFVDGVMKITSTFAEELDIGEAHAEALEINAAIDSMIEARQQIANKDRFFTRNTGSGSSREFLQRSRPRVVPLGKSYSPPTMGKQFSSASRTSGAMRFDRLAVYAFP